MSNESCTRCAALEAEIARLEDIITDLQARLDAIDNYTSNVIRQTEPILGRTSGVPRGVWAWNKSAYLLAKAIRRLTGGRLL
jgi:anti-sigma factor RsiW